MLMVNDSTATATNTPSPAVAAAAPKLVARDLKFYYGDYLALKNITMQVAQRKVTAIIGPSGCGKSTLLRIFNRIYSIYPKQHAEGEVLLDGENVLNPHYSLNRLRGNIAYAIGHYEKLSRAEMDTRVEQALCQAALWDEAKDNLKQNALGLSGGQQQRLCIARAVALKPEVILFDEPTSALDPIATGKIEQLVEELKDEYTIAIVTHNMQQASRISDYTAFMYLGELIEFGDTTAIFENPKQKMTEDYITGRYG